MPTDWRRFFGLRLLWAFWLMLGVASGVRGQLATAKSMPVETQSNAAETLPSVPVRPPARLELDAADVVWSGQFAPGTETQEVKFNKPVKGRYFCLESLSAQDNRPYAAVAELDLLGTNGYPLSTSGWKIAYADSEEHVRENGSAENAIDGNPSTYWHTQWSSASPNHPHHLVLDLGKSCMISGFRYLPRPGAGLPGGRIKDYRIYVGDSLVKKIKQLAVLPAKCRLLSYFTGIGTDGLHLAYSLNGYRWSALDFGHGLLKPEVGGKLMRDPCLMQGPDGTFHLVWTAAWTGNYIGYAASQDLVHWSPQRPLAVMTNAPGTINCWAPEVYWNAQRTNYLIIWSSTVSNRFGGGMQATNNRIYYSSTRDFKTFAPAKLFYNPGFRILDATILAGTNRYFLIFKDGSVNHLWMAEASSMDGPYGTPHCILANGSVEGPDAFWAYGQAIVCYHIMTGGGNGAMKSLDMQHWEDISSGMSLPADSGQGKVIGVTQQVLKPLQRFGLLQLGTTPEASQLGIGDWIWATHLAERQSCRFWRAFDIPEGDQVVRSELRMTADNSYTAYLDGVEIGRGGDVNSLAEYDLTWLMTPGHHVLAVEAFNDSMDAGLIAGLRVKLQSGRQIEIDSNPIWRVVPKEERHWKTRSDADAGWPHAQVVGYGGRAWWQQPARIVEVPPLPPPVVHFWQQPWVLAILLVACLTVAVLWIRQGVRLALQNRANSMLERERARIARDMHDELGSGLTQLTLLGELVLREAPQGDEPQKRLNELCSRARGLLRSMDEIVWTVNPRRDSVKDFAAYVFEHAQEFLTATSIRCRQEVADQLPDIPLNLPQRRNLLLAVKEAIRNAARHSGADEIIVKLAVADNSLRIEVADNGNGFSPTDTQVNRNGLVNMKQRLADIGGTFILNSAAGKGCHIIFSLPLEPGKNH